MSPLDALGHFAIGLIRNHQLQNWCRLAASLVISAVVTFLAVFGTSLLTLYVKGYGPEWDVIVSFGYGCSCTAGVLIYLWKTDPATKGIPISFPSDAELDALKKGITFDTNTQPKQ